MKPAELTGEEQTAILAERYSHRAEAYDKLWSPVIRPVGERLIRQLPLKAASSIIDVGTGAGALLPAIRRPAPSATILGVDRSDGMLRLAREKHSGSLALMDVQKLALPANRFDAAVIAFVLFHVPSPERCLSEVNRVLKPGGTAGTVTWGCGGAKVNLQGLVGLLPSYRPNVKKPLWCWSMLSVLEPRKPRRGGERPS